MDSVSYNERCARIIECDPVDPLLSITQWTTKTQSTGIIAFSTTILREDTTRRFTTRIPAFAAFGLRPCTPLLKNYAQVGWILSVPHRPHFHYPMADAKSAREAARTIREFTHKESCRAPVVLIRRFCAPPRPRYRLSGKMNHNVCTGQRRCLDALLINIPIDSFD